MSDESGAILLIVNKTLLKFGFLVWLYGEIPFPVKPKCVRGRGAEENGNQVSSGASGSTHLPCSLMRSTRRSTASVWGMLNFTQSLRT